MRGLDEKLPKGYGQLPQEFDEKYVARICLDLSGVEYWNGKKWIPLVTHPRLLRYWTTRWVYKLLKYRIRRKPVTISWELPEDWVKRNVQIDE